MTPNAPITIAGAAVHLAAHRQTARNAGLGDRDVLAADFEGYVEIPTSPAGRQPSPVEQLAYPAAIAALKLAECDPGDVDLVIYAWSHDQGPGVPLPHARLGRLLGAERAVTLGVQQMSGGGAAALEIASALLTASSHNYTTALIATADIFGTDPRRRWVEQASKGFLLGDGGTCAVVCSGTRRPAPLTVTALASSGRPGTELHTLFSFDPATPMPGLEDQPSLRRYIPAMRQCVSEAVTQALTASGLAPGDPRIRLVAFTRLGRTVLRRVYYPALPAGLPDPLALTAHTGHLGAGDIIANLAHIQDELLLAPGDYALLVSVAMGFAATAAVIQAPERTTATMGRVPDPAARGASRLR
jgi:3-oxoacyl-[acyl-carrier-protein] synthase III